METTNAVNVTSTTSPNSKEEQMFPVDYTVLETAIAAAALLVMMIVCLLGNAVICYVVFRNRRLWTEMNMFIVNLAIGDIAMSLLSMTTPLETVITGQKIFISGPLCQVNAFCNSVLFCNTIFTHTTISIDRFFAVVKPMKKIMTRRKALLALLGVWTLSIFISLGPLLGWGRNTYNGSTLQCGFGFPRNKFEGIYIICLAICAFFLPIVIMSYVYIRIYLAVRRHTRRLSTSTFGNNQDAIIKKQRTVVLTFFLALIAFIICWTPFFVFIAVAVSISSRDELPHGLGIAAYWCGFLNSAINPYLIGLRSERFHEAFTRFFCCLFCCCKRGNEPENEGKYSSGETAETKHYMIKQTTLSQRNGHVGSFTNMAFADGSASQETTDGVRAREILSNNRIKRSRSQEQDEEVVYPHFIHLFHGKLWSEATV